MEERGKVNKAKHKCETESKEREKRDKLTPGGGKEKKHSMLERGKANELTENNNRRRLIDDGAKEKKHLVLEREKADEQNNNFVS